MSELSTAGRRRPTTGGRGRRSRSAADDAGSGRGSRYEGPADPAGPAEPPGPAEDELGDPEQVARNICLRALTGAAKTRKQLADLLAKRGVPEEAATAVLDRFSEVGLIDDAAFARAWVGSRQAGRGLARRALSAELRAKGVDAEVAAAALEELDPQEEWDAARRLVARRLPSLQRFDRVTAERRLLGMLARKGYGGGLAGYVVREALDAQGLDDEAEDGPGADPLGLGQDAWLP